MSSQFMIDDAKELKQQELAFKHFNPSPKGSLTIALDGVPHRVLNLSNDDTRDIERLENVRG